MSSSRSWCQQTATRVGDGIDGWTVNIEIVRVGGKSEMILPCRLSWRSRMDYSSAKIASLIKEAEVNAEEASA